MQLFYYEHCPFCIRVLMLIHFKQIQLEKTVLLNDDEETPISMIGQKMLPVLKKDDGSFMPESLDVINYLDGLTDRALPEQTISEWVSSWLQSARHPSRELTYPRMIQHPFAEFATQSARDYFENKKSKAVGDFAENIANTDTLIAALTPRLQELDELIISLDHDQLTWDDIYLFPNLLLLTLVSNIQWPGQVKHYLLTKSAQLKLPLFANLA